MPVDEPTPKPAVLPKEKMGGTAKIAFILGAIVIVVVLAFNVDTGANNDGSSLVPSYVEGVQAETDCRGLQELFDAGEAITRDDRSEVRQRGLAEMRLTDNRMKAIGCYAR